MKDPLLQMKEEQSRERRGRLKVYLGMAAGVGKTYGMLVEGHQESNRKVDVVVGYLEAHGRIETESLAEGLEVLPLRLITHKGVSIKEFDIDAALTRKPQLILVDELAHSNAEGSRHSKRWQDVEELLRAEINVITTINIQHIESLRDVVAQITGIFVQETVPDAFFDLADEIELVDVPTEQLHQRLQEGKVYGQEKVDQALRGFFKRENLLALRELALRHTAEQVDRDLRETRAALKTPDSWHAGERILVCVAPNRMALRVVRSAKRLAASLHAEMLAVTVESSRQRSVSPKNREYQEGAMVLAEKLGAKAVNLAGDDIVAELVKFAQRENVSTIVMGKPIRNRWKEIAFGSVVDSVIRSSGDIDVMVITGAEDQGTPIFKRRTPEPSSWHSWVEVALAILVCTGLGFLIYDAEHLSNIIMLYLVGVVLVALRSDPRASITAAFLSICFFDFCFVPPRFTFNISDGRYMLTFLVMLAVSATLSALTLRLRESTRTVSLRERTTSALYDLSKSLAESRKKEDMATLTARKASEILNCPTAVFIKSTNSTHPIVSSSSGFESSSNEVSVAQWVMDHGRPAGASTDTLSGAKALYVPLNGSTGTLGTLALELTGRTPDLSQRNLIESISNQLAGALERAQFAKESNEAALQAESEQMRSNLLSAVSHDLRTPLASIEGSATSLLELHGLSDQGKELASTIQEESQRMARLIRNLLDMTRVQGTIYLDLDWQNVEDLVRNAVDRTSSLLEKPVRVTVSHPNILVRVDGVLIEQVIVNLLENAARHAGKSADVSVSISVAKQYAVITVSDDGPGFRPGQEQRIFDRFHRTKNSGFGLGLAICKAAIESHGGTISATNLAPGAQFRIELLMEEISE